MLSEEDLQQIKNMFEDVIKKLETDKKLQENDEFKGSLNNIVVRIAEWYSENDTRKQKVKQSVDSTDVLQYIIEEITELRTMYKDIIILLNKQN